LKYQGIIKNILEMIP